MAIDFDALWKGLLPGIVNAGAAYLGARNEANNVQNAAQQTRRNPMNIVSSTLGNATFDPATGTYTLNTAGAPTTPYYGASPEIVQALQGLTNTDAETADRLAALRGLAAPDEQRALVSQRDKLFAEGRLGGTGGGIEQEALYRAQAMADRQRTLDAADWAQNRALTRFQGALQTVNQGMGQQRQLADIALGTGGLGVSGDQSLAAQIAMALAGANQGKFDSIYGALSGAGGANGIAGLLGSVLQSTGNSTLGSIGSILNPGATTGGGIGDVLGSILGGGAAAGPAALGTGLTAIAPVSLTGATAGVPASVAAALEGALPAAPVASSGAATAATSAAPGAAGTGIGSTLSAALGPLSVIGGMALGGFNSRRDEIIGPYSTRDVNGNVQEISGWDQFDRILAEFQRQAHAAGQMGNTTATMDPNSPEYAALVASVLGPNWQYGG